MDNTNTTYADDFHFGWTITSMAEFDKAYAVKHVLQVLQQRGVSISTDKTVIILDIRGKHAKKALRRYVVKMSKGRCIRAKLGSQCLDLNCQASSFLPQIRRKQRSIVYSSCAAKPFLNICACAFGKAVFRLASYMVLTVQASQRSLLARSQVWSLNSSGR